MTLRGGIPSKQAIDDIDLMWAHRLRRYSSINPAASQRLVFARWALIITIAFIVRSFRLH